MGLHSIGFRFHSTGFAVQYLCSRNDQNTHQRTSGILTVTSLGWGPEKRLDSNADKS